MKCDLAIVNARILDVKAKEVFPGTLCIKKGVISRVIRDDGGKGRKPEPLKVLDAQGKFLSPGLIDGHLHIESSMLSPLEFSKNAVMHGTTSVFVDPHEIANVMGTMGIRLFLESSKTLPMDMFIGIPSCVPATHLETSGASISLGDIQALIKDSRVFGLAEMMNYPGIVHGFDKSREKVCIALRARKVVDGHCPGLSGKDLKTYISNGKNDGKVRIMSDHECTSVKEAMEKHRAGMFIHIRYGSASKDLDKILPELVRKKVKLDRFGLACDDLDAEELYEKGHMDRAVKRARDIIKSNSKMTMEQATIQAIAMASLNNAEYFSPFYMRHRLPQPGLIAEGRKANLVVFESLKDLKVKHVVHNGQVVVKNGRLKVVLPRINYKPWMNTVHLKKKVTSKIFKIEYNRDKKMVPAHVIGVVKNSILTDYLTLKVKAKRSKDGAELVADPARDIVKIAVIERHRGKGGHFVGFVKGLGIKRCAVASTIAHDSHNLIVAGTDDESMARAANFLARTGGGLAVVCGKKISHLPLSVAGLMSTQKIEKAVSGFKNVIKESQKLGTEHRNVFIVLSFLALPVIPSLKITDQGLVDVNRFEFTSLY